MMYSRRPTPDLLAAVRPHESCITSRSLSDLGSADISTQFIDSLMLDNSRLNGESSFS